uniref:Uncharacterized protein n=1 Tax=Oncorhynchus tshawytscha TaxID=74940 RepID=A0A8C8IWV5_ONCTS
CSPECPNEEKMCSELSKTADIAGGLAFARGLVGGPLGIAIQIKCYVTCAKYNRCRPYHEMLSYKPLTNNAFLEIGLRKLANMAQLTALVMGNTTLQQQVNAALQGYVNKGHQPEVQYVD